MSEMEPVKMEPVQEDAPAAESSKPGAYISARHRQDAVLKPVGPAGNYLLAGICAILAMIVYAVLLVMLYGDYTALAVA